MFDIEPTEKLVIDLARLQEDGAFVQVDTTGFSRLSATLSWRELGIEKASAGLDLKSPTFHTLPVATVKKYQRVANEARTALQAYSYRFEIAETLFGALSWRWMTAKAYQDFEASMRLACQRLDMLKQDTKDNYPYLIQQMRWKAKSLGASSRIRLRAVEAVLPDNFDEMVEDRILSRAPTLSEIEAISISHRVGALQMSADVLEAQGRELEERAKLEAAKLGSHYQLLDAKEELMSRRRIRELQIQSAREKIEQALAPMDEVAKQLYGAFADDCRAIVKSLEGRTKVPPMTAHKARALAHKFRMMAITPDADFEAMLKHMEELATVKEAKRLDAKELRRMANEVIKASHEARLGVLDSGRAAMLEI